MTEEKPNGKADAGDLWRNGDILLGIPDSFSRYREVPWIPGTWNSFCLSLSASKKQFDIVFNGVALVTEGSYNGFHLKETGNVWMMGGKVTTDAGGWNSLFGAMTDVNIWNRSFSQAELVQWTRCELQTKGNILNWDTAHWNTVGLNKFEMKKDEVCGTKETKEFLMIFKDEKTFDDTIRHCKAVGGEIAVASNTRAMQEMIEAAKLADECGSGFFSGYTDELEEGVWRDANTAEKMTWGNWSQGEPNNYDGDEHCTGFSVANGEINNQKCSKEYCPICRVKENTELHLQGICKSSYIDRFYVMQSPISLLGYIQTEMVWKEGSHRWEIRNMITNTTEAFTNSTSNFPIGKHLWYFLDKSDCNSTYLNLHLKIQQPGTFCCDDGFCIASELVCNNFENCKNREDEKNCRRIKIVKPKYRKENSPSTYDKLKEKFSDLNLQVATIILDVIDINEDQSFFYIEFFQKLKWQDENLEFRFLKENPYANLIKENMTNKMWMPQQQFCCYTYNEIPTEGNSRTFVSKSKNIKPNFDSDALNYYERYSGKNHPIFVEMSIRAKFSCKFENYKNYPFGFDTCFFMMYIPGQNNNRTNIEIEELWDRGPSSLGQYMIDWSVGKGKTIYDHSGLIYTLHLRRSIGSIILVTYLPTFLMNLINQATNYISSPDK